MDVQAASRPRGGAWTGPEEVGAGASAGLVLAARGDGAAAVGWKLAAGELRMAVRPPGGGGWLAAETAPAGGSNSDWSDVAIDADGRVTALSVGQDGGGDGRPYAAARTLTGGWEAPQALSRTGGDATDAHVAVDRDVRGDGGVAVVVGWWDFMAGRCLAPARQRVLGCAGGCLAGERPAADGASAGGQRRRRRRAGVALGERRLPARRDAPGPWGVGPARQASTAPVLDHDVALEGYGDSGRGGAGRAVGVAVGSVGADPVDGVVDPRRHGLRTARIPKSLSASTPATASSTHFRSRRSARASSGRCGPPATGCRRG